MALRKVILMIEEQGYAVDGMLVRKDDKLAIVTNLGRVESFDANEFGGIKLPEPVVEEPETATDEEIQRAREKYAWGSDDDIEIDDNAQVSRGDNGRFVQAWVWLKDEEKSNHNEMHEWDHHEEIRRYYKKQGKGKRYEIVDNALVGNISYYLVYQHSWPKGLMFHYMSANPDFSCAYDNLHEVGEPFKQWFIDAMNRYSEKTKS